LTGGQANAPARKGADATDRPSQARGMAARRRAADRPCAGATAVRQSRDAWVSSGILGPAALKGQRGRDRGRGWRPLARTHRAAAGYAPSAASACATTLAVAAQPLTCPRCIAWRPDQDTEKRREVRGSPAAHPGPPGANGGKGSGREQSSGLSEGTDASKAIPTPEGARQNDDPTRHAWGEISRKACWFR
jgi:hypothetical protein